MYDSSNIGYSMEYTHYSMSGIPRSAGGAGAPKALARRLRAAKDAAYREALLDAAELAFADGGYEGTGVKPIAASVGVSLTTLYRYFPTKLALYRAVHARRLDELMGSIRAAGALSREPIAQLLGGLRLHLEFHAQHPTYLRMHLREGNAWTGAARLRTEEQVAAWRSGHERMQLTFERGIADGSFVAEDPALLVRTTLALTEAHLSWWIDGGMPLAPEELCRLTFDRLVRACCREPARGAWLRRIEAGDLP